MASELLSTAENGPEERLEFDEDGNLIEKKVIGKRSVSKPKS